MKENGQCPSDRAKPCEFHIAFALRSCRSALSAALMLPFSEGDSIMSQHQFTTTPEQRVEAALAAVRAGQGVLVVDDEDRENEGDIIFSAEKLTSGQMAMLIRECSGIVCLCLPEERVRSLELPMMVANNTNRNRTAFTISIEAAEGVTTGVSASDRVTTIRAAIAPDAKPSDLHHPGHVFPLAAKPGGVLERCGHTEASVDIMRLAGLQPYGVLCELTNPDGTMARLPEVMAFGEKNGMPVLQVRDLVEYRASTACNRSGETVFRFLTPHLHSRTQGARP